MGNALVLFRVLFLQLGHEQNCGLFIFLFFAHLGCLYVESLPLFLLLPYLRLLFFFPGSLFLAPSFSFFHDTYLFLAF